MTDHSSGKKETAHENLLEILDNVIRQLDFTKKMIIIMVISFITVVPVSAIVINAVTGGNNPGVAIPIIAVAVFLIWLGVGIRQWIVFSRWTRKYRMYRKLQKELDRRLDFEKNDEEKSEKKEQQ
ncbi:hypothetical protein [Nitrososphaera viennensis]|uniref:Uncharacterized protein n=1 Tax=Nitrososphaera viennensis TaxID=1034015 RepID=A0A977IGD3_9ARCH|nr:hypothetical protein [Nitrososphaera viennensis]UVS70253.1 hypothetical protein NWT39_05555 [Nitrososphaera viennensis]